ncbi:MAG: 4Fe-4S binding protein [Candidatus Thermoplasmatota archaeon]
MPRKQITVGAINPEPGSSKRYKTGTWRSMRPVLREEKCKGCWICYRFCPDSSIIRHMDRKVISINYDYCKGCGICAHECPFDAIEMVMEEK